MEDGAEGAGGGNGPWGEEVEVGWASGSERLMWWLNLWTASLSPPSFWGGKGSCSSPLCFLSSLIAGRMDVMRLSLPFSLSFDS